MADSYSLFYGFEVPWSLWLPDLSGKIKRISTVFYSSLHAFKVRHLNSKMALFRVFFLNRRLCLDDFILKAWFLNCVREKARFTASIVADCSGIRLAKGEGGGKVAVGGVLGDLHRRGHGRVLGQKALCRGPCFRTDPSNLLR